MERWQMHGPALLGIAVTLLVAAVLVALCKRQRQRANQESRRAVALRWQLASWATLLLALVLVIIQLPLSEVTRGQILSLLGVLLTGVIAFSSTTFVANAMAGVMLRAVRTFDIGDFIEINERWGRVSDKGVFHTEIQTEQRDLLTVPHLYLATHPIKVIHKSGTVVSSSLSLGYDLQRQEIEQLLLSAASEVELEEPYVHIDHLGDHAITYKVSGFLADVGKLLTTKSNLRKSILDTLHGAGVEIVSPGFVNQRQFAQWDKALPPVARPTAASDEVAVTAEEIVFDKAESAANLRALRSHRHALAEWAKLGVDERPAEWSDDDAIAVELAIVERKISQLEAFKERA